MKSETVSGQVREFSRKMAEALHVELPGDASDMNANDSAFLVSEVIKYLFDFLSVSCSIDGRKEVVRQSVENACASIDASRDFSTRHFSSVREELLAAVEIQETALANIEYTVENMSSCWGMDLSSIFSLIHKEHMSAVFPDGSFHLVQDRKDKSFKVVKPEGWLPVDMSSEIERQVCGMAG